LRVPQVELREFEDWLQGQLERQIAALMRDKEAKAGECASLLRDLQRQAEAIAALQRETTQKMQSLQGNFDESIEGLKRQHASAVVKPPPSPSILT
jgi:uncharacterized protein involved in exopolysaccharide biosynthesis